MCVCPVRIVNNQDLKNNNRPTVPQTIKKKIENKIVLFLNTKSALKVTNLHNNVPPLAVGGGGCTP